jgi:hypothetical protein|tara:strand:+ start:5832 stop:6107 length:276 start_codon:yes stop_codon:yes gene_type:complete
MKIGTGGDSTNPMATDLDSPLASTTATKVSTGQSALDFIGTFSGATIAGQTIKEMAIFNSAGIMLSRVSFNPIGPFTASDSIELVFTLEVN